MLKLETLVGGNGTLPRLFGWNAPDPADTIGFKGGGLLSMLLISFGREPGRIFNFLVGGSPPESGPETITDVGTQDCCCCTCLLARFSWDSLSLLGNETDEALEFEPLIVTTVLWAAVGAPIV